MSNLWSQSLAVGSWEILRCKGRSRFRVFSGYLLLFLSHALLQLHWVQAGTDESVRLRSHSELCANYCNFAFSQQDVVSKSITDTCICSKKNSFRNSQLRSSRGCSLALREKRREGRTKDGSVSWSSCLDSTAAKLGSCQVNYSLPPRGVYFQRRFLDIFPLRGTLSQCVTSRPHRERDA